MSRGKLRTTSDICADCNAADPQWASVNRGVLVCDECCSVHRSLGRHISQIKSRRKGSWSPAQLNMVHQLVTIGANSIWEHSLLDPSQKQGRRKPNPRDPIHPTKADFIRAKYQFQAFANKHKETETVCLDDLSKQLHSSVRTGNLEISLRLLSLGADPNYFHPDKGNCPLHVAAQAGQVSQVELLVVYGADPGAYDVNGKTPVDHARVEGHVDLADRIVECQYELTDRLAFYLCGRKPDHRSGQHFIIPEMAESSLDLSELAKAAKKKLQALPNHLFEELAMDVYDEVDRRENDAIWLTTQNHSMIVSERQSVPFLPVNPEFSSTRNQGRQKLARFNAREFTTLIIDILSDARRRQLGVSSPSMSSMASTPSKEKLNLTNADHRSIKTSSLSDDEPIYDMVASDEDYASIGDSQSIKEEKPQLVIEKKQDQSLGSDVSDHPITVEEYLEVKRGLAENQRRVQQLVQTNKDLKQEISVLQKMVQKLMQENYLLKKGEHSPEAPVPNGHEILSDSITGHVCQSRPQSMFEARDQKRGTSSNSKVKGRDDPGKAKSDDRLASGSQRLAPRALPEEGDSDYDNANAPPAAESNSARSSSSARSGSTCSQATPTDTSCTASEEQLSQGATAYPDSGEEMALPTQDDVVKKTERITKKIQELLLSAQEGKHDSYVMCSEKIQAAVSDMVSLFPPSLMDEKMQMSLQLLTNGALGLQEQCRTPPPEINGGPDHRLKTQQVIQCAYDIAKAAKQLVMLFE